MTTTRECIKKDNLKKLGYNDLEHWLNSNPTHIYIGRNMSFYVPGAKQSKWANPFSVKKYGLDECLSRYSRYLVKNDELMGQLEELQGMVLGCWCQSDSKCHADVLIELLEKNKKPMKK